MLLCIKVLPINLCLLSFEHFYQKQLLNYIPTYVHNYVNIPANYIAICTRAVQLPEQLQLQVIIVQRLQLYD